MSVNFFPLNCPVARFIIVINGQTGGVCAQEPLNWLQRFWKQLQAG